MNLAKAFTLLLMFGATSCAEKYKKLSPKTLTADEIVALKADATALWELGVSRDIEKLVDMTLQRLIDIGGGRAATKAQLTKAFNEFDADGMVLEDFSLGNVSSVYRADDGYVVFVEHQSTISFGGSRGRVNGFYVAVGDVGRWKFIDSHGITKNPKTLRKLVPGLEPGATLPTHSVQKLP